MPATLRLLLFPKHSHIVSYSNMDSPYAQYQVCTEGDPGMERTTIGDVAQNATWTGIFPRNGRLERGSGPGSWLRISSPCRLASTT